MSVPFKPKNKYKGHLCQHPIYIFILRVYWCDTINQEFRTTIQVCA